jgi:hypothetical protein
MLAKRLSTIIPSLTFEESPETTKIFRKSNFLPAQGFQKPTRTTKQDSTFPRYKFVEFLASTIKLAGAMKAHYFLWPKENQTLVSGFSQNTK